MTEYIVTVRTDFEDGSTITESTREAGANEDAVNRRVLNRQRATVKRTNPGESFDIQILDTERVNTSPIGDPIRFYADGDYGDPARPEYDGFDGGWNMAGHDVWVTNEVFRANKADDMARHGATEEDWSFGTAYAVNHARETEHGTLYPLVDCALHYVGTEE